MRYLIINTDYPAFLSWFYGQYKNLDDCSYQTQLDLHEKTLFGVSAVYSKYLNKLKHKSTEIHANNMLFQFTWCKENNIDIKTFDYVNNNKNYNYNWVKNDKLDEINSLPEDERSILN